jgi:apolipoprotein N-acyltransferase
LIVLPETALPFMLQDVPRTVIGAMAEKAIAQGGEVLLGVALREEQAVASDGYRYYNGAVAFGTAPAQQYAKHHLVAFGEFVPPFFSWVYQWLKMPLSGFTPGAERQPPMRLAGDMNWPIGSVRRPASRT